jgi:hypothetical protein
MQPPGKLQHRAHELHSSTASRATQHETAHATHKSAAAHGGRQRGTLGSARPAGLSRGEAAQRRATRTRWWIYLPHAQPLFAALFTIGACTPGTAGLAVMAACWLVGVSNAVAVLLGTGLGVWVTQGGDQAFPLDGEHAGRQQDEQLPPVAVALAVPVVRFSALPTANAGGVRLLHQCCRADNQAATVIAG